MSLGLEVSGELPRNRDALPVAQVQEWIHQHAADLLRDLSTQDEDGSTVLLVSLHPAAEAVRCSFSGDNGFQVSAQTSAVGPGYHIYICNLIRKMGEDLGVRWKAGPEDSGDDTNYFETGDEQPVNQHMLLWLSTVCKSILDERLEPREAIAIAMPMGTTYETDALLITPTGPRSRRWAERVASDPENGRDFFAWWQPDRGAPYYLNRALCLMWTDVRWRRPLIESETLTLNEVIDCLEQAHRFEPTLRYPLHEWRAIAEYLDRPLNLPSPDSQRQVNESELIGYRRNRVRVSLAGGWSIRIPGGFAESWDDGTWGGWDPAVTVWVTAYSSEHGGSATPAEQILQGITMDSEDVVTHQESGLLGRGCISWVEQEGYWRLRARSAVTGRFCLCTICYGSDKLRDQALEIWRSLAWRG
jgi:hypothetical protein